jgi:hypothetical protein
MGERHGEAQLRLAAGIGARPVEQELGEASGRGAGEREAARVEKDFVILALRGG